MENQNSALAIRSPGELAEGFESVGVSLGVRSQTEVQAAVIMAKQFPRNEEAALQKIERACKHPELAAKARYAFKRAGRTISGPSIKLMTSIAAYWGNLDFGHVVIGENEEGALVRGYTWDLETNVRTTRDHFVRKTIQRKQEDGSTQWVKPDERDWRELCGNIGSRLVRVTLEKVIPDHVWLDALETCRKTITAEDSKDPDAAKKSLISAFGDLNVPVSRLQEILGHPIGEAAPSELQKLREVYRSIRDGEQSIADFLPKSEPERASINPGDLGPSASENRGHDATQPEKDEAAMLRQGISGKAQEMERLRDTHGVERWNEVLIKHGIKDLSRTKDVEKLNACLGELTQITLDYVRDDEGGPQPVAQAVEKGEDLFGS